jgi:hypothetical protein
MSRRVRRAPLSERLANYLDPRDWLLWLSEEVQTSDWAKVQGKPTWLIGLGCNLLFMVALSSSKGGVSASNDDVFGDYATRNGSGWLRAFCSLLTWGLAATSLLNTFYVFTSTRKYRLFERALEDLPKTPSARRVRVDDSPVAPSPAKYLADKLAFGSNSAQQRAHPDETRDVVELSIWDPPALCLRLFTLFSPAHLIVYWSFLPPSSLEATPSVTVVKTSLLAVLITTQSFAFEAFFTQQVADKLILSQEVLHEYDTKYVHPSINRPARDVAIQTPPQKEKRGHSTHKEMGTDPMPQTPEVEVSREYTIINRGFKTNPNPAYASHYDKNNHLGLQNGSAVSTRSHNALTPAFHTPAGYSSAYTGYTSTGAGTGYGQDMSSPLRAPETMAPPSGFANMPRRPTGERRGDGGSFGVYSSANSPLKKAASHSNMRPETAAEQLRRREGSPLKRMSLPAAEQQVLGGNSTLNSRLKDLRGDGTGGSSRRQSGRF